MTSSSDDLITIEYNMNSCPSLIDDLYIYFILLNMEIFKNILCVIMYIILDPTNQAKQTALCYLYENKSIRLNISHCSEIRIKNKIWCWSSLSLHD